jgi:succinate-semialdehyde dehydrogenase / glutarate-semialdehyde dehydrogenase
MMLEMSGLSETVSALVREELYIDGEWVDGEAEAVEVRDPSSGALIATVASASARQVEQAIVAADRAFVSWSALLAKERAEILRRWYDLIVAHADALGRIVTAEQGKPLAEGRGEILYGASFVEWFAEEAKRAYGDVVPTTQHGRRTVVIKQPIGVCAAITPWNFPSAMILRKVAPALAAGCTMVLKPASETPLSALALAELGAQAGIPAGVFNVVHGPAQEVGAVMTSHPAVRALTFTGSTAVGKLLAAQCASTVKRVLLELGGNAPLIVFDDADLDLAIAGAVASKFRNAGQTCVCANRILVQSGIHDAFVARLTEAAVGLEVGDGLDPDVAQGPLITQDALAKVERHVQDAITLGATVQAGGKRHARGGTFYEPTVLTGATSEMLVARDETFGPVAAVFRFETEADAIALANDTESGLAAYFFTRDVGRAWRLGEALEFGIVAINTGIFSSEAVPFGGVKQSGLGREGSRHGLDDYLEMKYLCFDGID